MTSFGKVWDELKAIYSPRLAKRPFFANRVTSADIDRWSAQLGVSRREVCDRIAIELAREFHDVRLDFTFCDAVINDMSGIIHWQDAKGRLA